MLALNILSGIPMRKLHRICNTMRGQIRRKPPVRTSPDQRCLIQATEITGERRSQDKILAKYRLNCQRWRRLCCIDDRGSAYQCSLRFLPDHHGETEAIGTAGVVEATIAQIRRRQSPHFRYARSAPRYEKTAGTNETVGPPWWAKPQQLYIILQNIIPAATR